MKLANDGGSTLNDIAEEGDGCPPPDGTENAPRRVTGPVDRRERQHVERVLRRFLGDLSETTVAIDQLCLIVEPEPLAPFIIHSVHRFGQLRKRRSA